MLTIGLSMGPCRMPSMRSGRITCIGARERYGVLKTAEMVVERSAWCSVGGLTGVPSIGFAVRMRVECRARMGVRWRVRSDSVESAERAILILGC